MSTKQVVNFWLTLRDQPPSTRARIVEALPGVASEEDGRPAPIVRVRLGRDFEVEEIAQTIQALGVCAAQCEVWTTLTQYALHGSVALPDDVVHLLRRLRCALVFSFVALSEDDE